MDIVQSMMEVDLISDIPDALIGPSDFIGHADAISLFPIDHLDEKIYADGVTTLVKMNGKIWGYPLVWGNHLMLLHDGKTPAIERLEELKKPGSSPIGMHVGEPYVFLMFVLGQFDQKVKTFSGVDLTEASIVKALKDYQSFVDGNAVPKDCDYQCVTRDFYQGKLKYAINGDWVLAETEKHMGTNVRLAALPKFNQLQLRSPCASTALMLTKTVKDNLEKKRILAELAMFLLQKDQQLSWFKNARRSPANKIVYSELVKSSGGNDKVMLDALASSVCILPDQRISAMWPAMRKGLRLYMSGARSAEDAAKYILQLSN